jgi:hypothetical protein
MNTIIRRTMLGHAIMRTMQGVGESVSKNWLVTELAKKLPLRRSLVAREISWALTELKRLGLVKKLKDGTLALTILGKQFEKSLEEYADQAADLRRVGNR